MKSLRDYVSEALKIRHGDHVVVDGKPHTVVSITKKHLSALHPDGKEIVQYKLSDFKKRFKART
jgi:hypothetical protein